MVFYTGHANKNNKKMRVVICDQFRI